MRMATAPVRDPYVLLLVKDKNETNEMKDVWKSTKKLINTYIYLSRKRKSDCKRSKDKISHPNTKWVRSNVRSRTDQLPINHDFKASNVSVNNITNNEKNSVNVSTPSKAAGSEPVIEDKGKEKIDEDASPKSTQFTESGVKTPTAIDSKQNNSGAGTSTKKTEENTESSNSGTGSSSGIVNPTYNEKTRALSQRLKKRNRRNRKLEKRNAKEEEARKQAEDANPTEREMEIIQIVKNQKENEILQVRAFGEHLAKMVICSVPFQNDVGYICGDGETIRFVRPPVDQILHKVVNLSRNINGGVSWISLEKCCRKFTKVGLKNVGRNTSIKILHQNNMTAEERAKVKMKVKI